MKKNTKIAAVEFNGRGGEVFISSAGRIVHSHFAREDAARVIKDFAKKNGGARGLALVLPRRIFIMKFLTLPTQNEVELRKMVALQLPVHLPYKPEDIIWDLRIVEKTADGSTKSVLTAASIKVVEQYLKDVAAAGFFPDLVTISSWGIWSLLKERHELDRPGCVAFVHAKENGTEICFCGREGVIFSRQIDAEQVTDASPVLEHFQKTLALYKEEGMGPLPSKVIVFSRSLDAEDLAQKLSIAGLTGKAYEPLKDAVPSAGAGILLGDWKAVPNFLPDRLKDLLDVRAKRRRWLVMGLTGFLAFGSLVSAILSPLIAAEMNLKRVRSERASLRPALKDMKSTLEQRETILRSIYGQVAAVEMIEELYRLTPPDISYSSLRVNAEGEVTLQGQTFNGTSVNELQSRLVTSVIFRNVILQQAVKRTTVMGDVMHFTIKAMAGGEGGQP